ncbi:hypothetical protein Avbf_08297 [Armadillidium vulgare]|nr:hypothetical protein Avbf_08297 [Armadillidium vulgare]
MLPVFLKFGEGRMKNV